MHKTPSKDRTNVLHLPLKRAARRKTAPAAAAALDRGALAAAGSAGDPRMQEALRMAKAFLAIEDATARTSLVVLAERLATHRWAVGVKEG